MESHFIKLASTELSDSVFFEEVFLSYLNYRFPDTKKCMEDLAQIRSRFNQKDPHTHHHLRDQIESVLYRYNQMEQAVLVAEHIQMKRRIEQLEKRLASIPVS